MTAGASDDYSFIDRMLHRLILGSPARGEMLLDIEHSMAPAPPEGFAAAPHVFVSGLARAGTTIMMRALHESGQFASLTYKDMPFVMAPGLWAKMSGGARRNAEAKERAHADGILVNVDSPEALEEPFWQTFAREDYIRPDRLQPHTADDDTIEKYRMFVGHVLSSYGRGRYLAKNNNAILRFPSILKALPGAVIIIPFRDPVTQALSLKAQHDMFAATSDKFTRDYMRWLAHHEFGPDQRPFAMNGEMPPGGPSDINYWLSMWVSVYDTLAGQVEDDLAAGRGALLPVAYEGVCAPDSKIWTSLCDRLGLGTVSENFHPATVKPAPEEVDAALLARARNVYERLCTLGNQALLTDKAVTFAAGN